MRFVILRKADRDTEAGAMPSDQLAADMAGYMDELQRAGVLVGGDGLKPSSAGVRVSVRAGRPTVIDGPFTEAKELIAGYTVIDVASRDEAIAWARRWPTSDGRGDVQLELRPLWELAEFGDGEGVRAIEAVRKRSRGADAPDHGDR